MMLNSWVPACSVGSSDTHFDENDNRRSFYPVFFAVSCAAGISELVDPLCRMGVKLHVSVSAASDRFLAQQRRRNYTTPTSYLELIRLCVGSLSACE